MCPDQELNQWLFGLQKNVQPVRDSLSLFLFEDFIYLFIFVCLFTRERGREGKEREGEKHWCERETSITCLPYMPWWIKPTTQVCALTGNQTSDLLICGVMPNWLSHTSCAFSFELISYRVLLHLRSFTYTLRGQNSQHFFFCTPLCLTLILPFSAYFYPKDFCPILSLFVCSESIPDSYFFHSCTITSLEMPCCGGSINNLQPVHMGYHI